MSRRFCPTRFLEKEDGSKLEKGDSIEFIVLEFLKNTEELLYLIPLYLKSKKKEM